MSMENALALSIKAFEKVRPTSAKKRETLADFLKDVEFWLYEKRKGKVVCHG
ncbi:MAG: hypothetical protein QW468_04310 [Candidatus Bathyarchaeia archaeon]